MADEVNQDQDVPLSYGKMAEDCLDQAAQCVQEAPDMAKVLAIQGVGYAILSHGEGEEQFHSAFTEFARMFRGGDGKAMIDAWVSK